jgi:hypothetical protein
MLGPHPRLPRDELTLVYCADNWPLHDTVFVWDPFSPFTQLRTSTLQLLIRGRAQVPALAVLKACSLPAPRMSPFMKAEACADSGIAGHLNSQPPVRWASVEPLFRIVATSSVPVITTLTNSTCGGGYSTLAVGEGRATVGARVGEGVGLVAWGGGCGPGHPHIKSMSDRAMVSVSRICSVPFSVKCETLIENAMRRG